MEQPRTRPPQNRSRRPAPLPPQAGPHGRGATARGRTGGGPPRRPAPLLRRVRALPNPRLTGLGGGLFCLVSMALLGGLAQVLFDGSTTVYGVLFLLLSALTAVWVRPAELITAPVCVPIAFAVGAVPLAEGSGPAARAMGVFTVLALHADWLYGGTLLAGLVVTVRKARQLARRAAAVRAARAERSAAPPAGRAPAPPRSAAAPSARRTPAGRGGRPAPQRAPGPRRRTV
ncbi:DUF6542 domain-containing protein [Streptomyces sp. NPDC002490]|uniref:DUF6542 domain-containing protein n=1 Tax=Streptomyces sp. NPDC002490 TaxID=3154416 RepID=UPI0033211041